MLIEFEDGKKREVEGNGERRGETREWMAITLVQTHLLTVEFWYRLICFDGGQIRHESTEEKTFDFHSILVFACFFNHPRWETLSRCPALFNIQPLIFFLFFHFLFFTISFLFRPTGCWKYRLETVIEGKNKRSFHPGPRKQ